MLQRLHGRTRAILVMLCMALMAVVAAQGAITAVDRTQHALGQASAITALATLVHYDHGLHEDRGAVDAVASRVGELAQDPDGAHHHFAEGPQLTLASDPRLADLVSARARSLGALRSDGMRQHRAGRLERPPKSSAKLLA